MRTFAHHDAAGTIVALVGVEAPEGVEVMLQPEPGGLVTEVEGVDPDLDRENVEAVKAFLDQHKLVVRPAQPATLVSKD